jgi:hypothetical protein
MNYSKIGMAYVGKHVVDALPSGHTEEVQIPGLIEPTLCEATLKHVNGVKSVVITGKFFKEQTILKMCGSETVSKITDFEQIFEVPINAKNPIPKVTLVTSKDECGQVANGLLRVQWEVADVNVPIEIKDCAE